MDSRLGGIHLEEGGDNCTSHGKQPLLTDEWPKALRNALPMLLPAPTASSSSSKKNVSHGSASESPEDPSSKSRCNRGAGSSKKGTSSAALKRGRVPRSWGFNWFNLLNASSLESGRASRCNPGADVARAGAGARTGTASTAELVEAKDCEIVGSGRGSFFAISAMRVSCAFARAKSIGKLPSLFGEGGGLGLLAGSSGCTSNGCLAALPASSSRGDGSMDVLIEELSSWMVGKAK